MVCKHCNSELTGKHRNVKTFCNRICKSDYLMLQWVGKKFHKLTIIESYEDRKVKCTCDCGNTVIISLTNLTRKIPNTTSCGCLWGPAVAKSNTKHGHSTKTKSPTYSTWVNMIARCYTPSATVYSHYGARGITVCDRWRNDFANFLSDMGEKPSKDYSIDRIDNSGNYEPGNCRWATMKEQCANRRKRSK